MKQFSNINKYKAGPGLMDNYKEDYFNWQKNVGAFGGIANLYKFEALLQPEHTVLDFGCGGGFLLRNLSTNQKYGFDINTAALENAKSIGIKTFNKLSELPVNFFDRIISNHALEHVTNPFDTLTELRQSLKTGGKLVFVVPHEDCRQTFTENDINMHLYTWNPQTLGNLFKYAGFSVESIDLLQHKWPNNFMVICQKVGWKNFHRISRMNAILTRNFQVRIVASKP